MSQIPFRRGLSAVVAVTAALAGLPVLSAVSDRAGPAVAIPDLTSANRRAPIAGLPDWSKAGYRGGGAALPTSATHPNAACHISPARLASQYGVRPDGSDATTGLQAAIDAIRTTCTPTAGFDKLSSITLPAGRIVVTRQLGVDADYLLLKGAGMGATVLAFRPDTNTRYDALTPDGSDWDEDGMTHGAGKGGWMWPGRGLLRVQTRDVASRYANDYASAPANRKDIFEGSVNQHWAGGVALRESSTIGSTQIRLASNADMSRFKVGGHLWVGAANSVKFYQQQTVTDSSKYMNLHMRQQIFQIATVDAAGKNLTIDKPLEYDLPLNSTADGSTAIGGTVYPSRVTPLKVVQGVGIEDLTLTQDMTDMPKLGGGTYNLNRADAKFNYGNMAPEYEMHGVVLKWAANTWIRRVSTDMTGSHAVVTESAKNIQVQESSFDGSWNKGKGGNGYFRGSRVWDSLYAYNTSRNLRHFTFQWSASNNVAIGNDFDSDLNVHGGWERRNLFENNLVTVPFEHSSKNCRSNCGDEGGGPPDNSTWWPIWWAAGPKAAKWSDSSGAQNVFYNNDLSKQTTQGGSYQSYYPDRQRLYQFGSSASDATKFQHLALNGSTILDWAGNETANFTNNGVNASRTDPSGSLFLKSSGSGNDTTPPSTPGNLRSTGTTSSSVSLAWNAATDNVGVTGYLVYRNGAEVGTPSGTTHTDTGLAAATSYTYTVKARDAAGNLSAASNAVTATTQPEGGGNTIDVSTSAQLIAALGSVQPGQTIRLAAGEYHGAFQTQRAGTASARISLTGPANAVLVNDGPSGTAPSCPAPGGGWDSGYGLWLFGAPYWNLTGFTVKDSKKGIVLDNSHHVTIDGVYVHHTDEEAVHFRRSSADGVIRNSRITHTGLVQAGFGEAVYLGSANSNWGCHGNSGGVDRSDRVKVLNNTLGPQVAAEHIDVKEGTFDGLIQGNTFNGTGISGQNSADSWVDVKGINYVIDDNTGTFSSPGTFANGYETHNPSTSPSFLNGCGTVWRNNDSNLGNVGQYAIKITSTSKCSSDPNVVYSSNTVTNARQGLTNIPVTQ